MRDPDSQPAARLATGRYAAYAALVLAVLGLLLISVSDSGCEFVGGATQDYSGRIGEPGNTGGVLAFTLAPLIAIAALVLLVRTGHYRGPACRLALGAAIVVFPLAVLNFMFWTVKAGFACGPF